MEALPATRHRSGRLGSCTCRSAGIAGAHGSAPDRRRSARTATTSGCGGHRERRAGPASRVGSRRCDPRAHHRGCAKTFRRDGFTEATARAIAATGGFNQALIFYRFGSLEALLDEAWVQASERQVARYREAAQQLTA